MSKCSCVVSSIALSLFALGSFGVIEGSRCFTGYSERCIPKDDDEFVVRKVAIAEIGLGVLFVLLGAGVASFCHKSKDALLSLQDQLP